MTNTTQLPGFPEWQVLCVLATFVGLFGAAAHLAQRQPEGSRVQASLRTFAGILLPPSVYLWLGAPLADWAFAVPRPFSFRLGELATLGVSGFLLSRLCPDRLRLQPFVLATGIFAGLVLPLAWAATGLAEILKSPLVDSGFSGMAVTCLVGFLVPLRQGRNDPPPSCAPDPAAFASEGWLILAWVAACLAWPLSSPSLLVQVLVAMGAALCGQLGMGWVRTGTASAERLLEAPLAGALAILPGATLLNPTAAALGGLIGGGGSLAVYETLRHRLPPKILTLLRLGIPAAAGLVLAPWFASEMRPSLSTALAPLAWIVFFGALGVTVGFVFWHGQGQAVRLEPTPEEAAEGMDYCDLGLARKDLLP
jgi:ammonia channel protein AmtB